MARFTTSLQTAHHTHSLPQPPVVLHRSIRNIFVLASSKFIVFWNCFREPTLVLLLHNKFIGTRIQFMNGFICLFTIDENGTRDG